MKTRILSLAALSVLALSACSGGEVDNTLAGPQAAILEAHGLSGDVREVIEQLEATPLAERSPDFIASVRPHELQVSDATTAEPVSIPIPEDDFYLSVAPYVNSTHECYFHSLTTCSGELAGEEVSLTVTDSETGEVLVDTTTTTNDNGFVAVWLPRDIEGTLTVEHDGLVAEQDIATGPEDATCVTTMQLA